jgi:alpha-L-fucosidase
MYRRRFIGTGAAALASLTAKSLSGSGIELAPARNRTSPLRRFEQMTVGVSYHFGMNTFTGNDYDEGTAPATTYNPTSLNVDQWLAAAEHIGARYAILTAKHMSGFCLWNAEKYSYDVAASGNTTDVVAAFVDSCRKRHIVPGLYYCILDPRNENNQGHYSMTEQPNAAYFKLILSQIRELHRKYAPLGFQVFDIPGKLSADQRWQVYRAVKELDPDCLLIMNQTWDVSQQNRGRICVPEDWPTDLIFNEDALPPSEGHDPLIMVEGTQFYMPLACWIPAGGIDHHQKFRQWFWSPDYKMRPVQELWDLYAQTTSRNASFLLNLSPDSRGLLPDEQVDGLRELGRMINRHAITSTQRGANRS